MGTTLLTRTTRPVALTGAGFGELLGRAKVILDDAAAAAAAARRIAHADACTVKLGITPPVAPVLAPHLIDALSNQAPEVDLVTRMMWAPDLARAITDGTVGVAITCGRVPDPPGVIGESFCAEPLFVVLQADHRLAAHDSVRLADLGRDHLGMPSDALFPAWALAQRQALDDDAVMPPMIELAATDLAATEWTAQPRWTGSLRPRHSPDLHPARPSCRCLVDTDAAQAAMESRSRPNRRLPPASSTSRSPSMYRRGGTLCPHT